MQAAACVMVPAGRGSIVNISSIDGVVGMPGFSAYVACKWAVRGMTKTAALELGPHGVRCNSIHPGFIETDMFSGGGRSSHEAHERMAQSVPLRFTGGPTRSPRSTYSRG
jgi:3alpha(or 20beta)-hydroxysteroid dehydrogenase